MREAMLSKLEGLSEYDIRRPLTPTGTNLLGLIKHLSIVRVLEETNRHADILREQLDGAAGIATDNPNLPQHDAAWWENYRAQVERAARAAEPDKRR